MSVVDLSVTPVLVELQDCLSTQVAQVTFPPFGVACLRPGDRVDLLLSTTRDECCEGLAWVRVVGGFDSAKFPAPDQLPTKCIGDRMAVVLEMGVARCAPTPDATAIPTCEEWTEVTQRVMDDWAAMRRAARCFQALNPTRLMIRGGWQPLPTEGGCVGGTLLVTVAVQDCD